jgi:hypothetical protein
MMPARESAMNRLQSCPPAGDPMAALRHGYDQETADD